MPSKTVSRELPLLDLYEKFIADNKKGRRLQPNGRTLSPGTIQNYSYTLRLLQQFSTEKSFPLRMYCERHLDKRGTQREKRYWKKFYTAFTTYLAVDCGHFDNYIGQNFKNIKTFFNYLNKDLAMGVGEFHRQFYVRKEDIPIFPLMPEELTFLIYNEPFALGLTPRMREVRDFFVFGCTVALRVSDLLALKQSNLRLVGDTHYLVVRSIKTATDTLVRLPDYCIDIVLKYGKKKGSKLLPAFNKSNLNQYIKQLLEAAGLVHEVVITREKRGKQIVIKKSATDKSFWRFCDVASTHTMRRTAITTMLCLGMPEGMVRKISGHAPHTKEFYRYVLWAQSYQDVESEKMFLRLKEKSALVA